MELAIFKLMCAVLFFSFNFAHSKKSDEKDKPDWAKKDIRHYTDVDLERLLDQWEEDEEPLPEDELPEHLRKPEPLDLSNLDTSDPEKLLQMTKKGKTLMMFVSVSDNPSREETEKITSFWQGSLFNNHIQVDRFLVDDHRAIFMFKDGAQAWDAKDFIVQQERCLEVTIDNKVYKSEYKKPSAKKNGKKKEEL